MSLDYLKYINDSSTHYISNSGKDESNTYRGGQAGDQSTHEWELKKWYNRPWTVVLRYPDIRVGIKIAELGIAAALNDKIGYDQNQRTSYWTQLQKVNYDPSAITTTCEEDCTAGVTANVKAAGYLLGIKSLQVLSTSIYSGNMKTAFVKAGFNTLASSKHLTSPDYLLPGDILLYEGHHAATNISYGKKVDKADIPGEPETKPDDDELIPTASYVSITNGKYHVRTLPDKKSKSLGVAENGEKLIYAGDTENGWWKVQYGFDTGWISSKCGSLTIIEPAEEEPFVSSYDEECPSDDLEPSETSGEVDVVKPIRDLRVKSIFAKMRSAAGTSFMSLATLRKGTLVQYLGEEMDGWLYVRYKDIDGWVKIKTVEEVD